MDTQATTQQTISKSRIEVRTATQSTEVQEQGSPSQFQSRPKTKAGVILAGGQGTRLRPMTKIMNKHLLPVYDKPMIDYPIQTLKDYGCEEIILVTGGEHIGAFAEYLGDSVTYRVQTEPNGIAGALACVDGLVDGVFPVILGDNYFSQTPRYSQNPSIFLKYIHDPQRFGVYQDGRIVEKPEHPKSNLAVTGFYVYDTSVFDFIKTMHPSTRGELEITDVNNWYLDNKLMHIHEYGGNWRDMGTIDTLLEVANRVKRLKEK